MAFRGLPVSTSANSCEYYKGRTAASTTAQTIDLEATRRIVRAWLDDGASSCHVSWYGEASTTDPAIDNTAWPPYETVFDEPGTSSMYVVFSGVVGYLNVEAW